MIRMEQAEMEYRRLGRSGLMISKFVLGTMNFGEPTGKAESIRMIHATLDVGSLQYLGVDVERKRFRDRSSRKMS